MSNRSKSLKAQNAWLIRGVLALHVVAFLLVVFGLSGLMRLATSDTANLMKTTLAPLSLALVSIVLAKLLVLGVVRSRARDRLIHWRWSHPLPGARAFSKLGPEDTRVDMSALERRYGPLPTAPKDQDSKFYKIYREHVDEVGVVDAHRSYLAARDVAMINFVLLFVLPFLAWWAADTSERIWWYAGAIFLSYALCARAAQVYGVRFVENVLASASIEPASATSSPQPAPQATRRRRGKSASQ